jgi:hypothetical protein
MSRFYFHCSDGVDLVLDREGVESEASDVLWLGMRAAERLITALPSYDDWPAWTVSVHDERGSLVETLSFPANMNRRDALHFQRALRDALHTRPHFRTRPEARGIIDAPETGAMPVHHQRT